MREIDNKLNNSVKFNGIQKPQVGEEAVADLPANAAADSRRQIEDLKDMPEAALGKSQVAAPSSIADDMQKFQERPDLVAIVNEAVERYAQNHTEEETLEYLNSAYNEFFK